MEKQIVRRQFSVNFKLHCIAQFETSKNLRRTARMNGINRSTLRNWVRNKILLQNVCNKSKEIYFN